MNITCNSWIVTICTMVPIFFLLHYFLNVEGREKYTEEEMSALEKFRNSMGDVLYKDYMKSDVYLIRWLRAQNFNMSGASEMLRNAMDWRKKNDIDNIVNETIFKFQNPPFYMDGVDYDGGIVSVGLIGRLDMRNILLKNRRATIVRYAYQLLERYEVLVLTSLGIIGNNSRLGSSTKGTTIIDYHGFSLRQHACPACIRLYMELLPIVQNYYPGYYRHLIGINVPRIASPLIELIKSLISQEYRDIIKIYGQNRIEWITALQEIVPPDQVRPNFGGTKVDT